LYLFVADILGSQGHIEGRVGGFFHDALIAVAIPIRSLLKTGRLLVFVARILGSQGHMEGGLGGSRAVVSCSSLRYYTFQVHEVIPHNILRIVAHSEIFREHCIRPIGE
jgi:hypothetical protein